ncbi:hypothetical protein ACO0QE_000383 [Hanseniaspora vineae]
MNTNEKHQQNTLSTEEISFTSNVPEYHEPKEELVQPLPQEALMDCIQNNKLVPNHIQVSDTVLNGDLASKSTLPARAKPWEVKRD